MDDAVTVVHKKVHTEQTPEMKALYDSSRHRFKIIVPTRFTGTGKRRVSFWKTKEEAETEIRRILKHGGMERPKVSGDALAFLHLVDTKYQGDFGAALGALTQYARITMGITKPGATLEDTCLAYIAYHVAEKSNRRTVYKYRSTLRRLCADLNGNLPVMELTEDMVINTFLKRWGPGVTRLSQQRNVQAFVAWATRNGYLGSNPLAKIETRDSWESNKEILPVEDFRRILLTCAEKFPRLLPYFVLGGLAGVRRAEMISSEPVDRDPRIEWTDIDFKLNKIRIRDEVAKQTNAADRRRSIPLESAAREWLQLVAKTEGPIMAISQSQLQRDKSELLELLKLKVPDNALRNSYASYGCAFRSIGDVARAMGDLEVTIKRYYVDLVDDPELGRAWFDIFPGQRKIVPMQEVA